MQTITTRRSRQYRTQIPADGSRLTRVPRKADSGPTTAAFLERWLETRRTQLRYSTWRSYALNVRTHIVPACGMIPLKQVTTEHLNGMYADLLERGRRDGKGGLHPRTVKYIHMIAKRVLNDAMKWGVIDRNPADAAEPPRIRDRHQLAVWNADELRRFLRHVEADRLYAAWLLSATTGLRRGELLGLRWQDIDLDAATASVRQTLLAVGFQISIGQPKTGRGYRQVALFDAAVEALRGHRAAMIAEYAAHGDELKNDGLIFTKEDGSPLHPDRVSELFDLHLKAAGLPRIRLHDLRHTHATLGLAAGIHPKIMSERLGHSSVSITLDTYSHAIPGMQKEAAERMSALLFEKPLVPGKKPLVNENNENRLAKEPV